MRTLAMILIADAVLLGILLLAWADLLRPLVYTLLVSWLAAWIGAAYLHLATPNVGASLACFSVALVTGIACIVVHWPRQPKHKPGMIYR